MAPTSPALVHTGAAEPARSKFDLNHIPRPIPSSIVILLETRQGNQPATSDYIIKDTGNCSPRLMRCTINQNFCQHLPCSWLSWSSLWLFCILLRNKAKDVPHC